ncbi:MarR family transcriptional regulator [Rhizobium pusense]|nr:MarR family transcriptional regulator [Agrobacterium pusense]MBW9085015.1 MarR family transcriptional regulator [Agrobacterium pusense]MBW9125510.1 MarR family transcriptional regulator [Agrobacterium pusense]MBW9137925.1 MarR family transcriptional regulator [Agrobacterium pusense]
MKKLPLRDHTDTENSSVGAWTKRCYLAGRAVMDECLRPFDLGSTQWYVLWYLVNHGPSVQRDLGRALELERATLSGIIATLVRKDLIAQTAHGSDQRQRLLTLTAAGETLWRRIPDLSFIHDAAFGGIEEADLATTIRVLKSATERLQTLLRTDRI